ncbi:hypothetical protein [Peribacillus muralis]|uniref:hypothetical protein n=1 Tax=Peribacillus muralis TaxID=264697 RepID=UPI00366F267B
MALLSKDRFEKFGLFLFGAVSKFSPFFGNSGRYFRLKGIFKINDNKLKGALLQLTEVAAAAYFFCKNAKKKG